MIERPGDVGRGDRHALLIEADDAYRAAMAECARLAGYRTHEVATLDSASAALDGGTFDVVVWGSAASDARRRGAAFSQLRARIDAPLLLIDGSPEAAQVAVEMGADQWLPKPFVPSALVDAVRAVMGRSSEVVSRSSEAGTLSEWKQFLAARRRSWAVDSERTLSGKQASAISSNRDDVTLLSASGGSARGSNAVDALLGPVEARFSTATTTEVLAEHVSRELACTVEIVRCEEPAAGHGKPEVVELRLTIVYRRENGDWKVVHRHADPLVSPSTLAHGDGRHQSRRQEATPNLDDA